MRDAVVPRGISYKGKIMQTPPRRTLERFRVSGNILKLTARFDPRYQPRAGMELISIISSLAREGEGQEVVLDMSDASSMPSMMLGFLKEAQEVTLKSGKKLKVRLKEDIYNRLLPLGVLGAFSPTDGSLELVGGGNLTHG